MQERNICIAWFVLVFIHVHSLFCQSVSWTRRSWMRWRPRPGDTIFESFVRLEISETSLPNPFWFSPFGQAVLSPQAIVLRYDAGGTKFGQIWVNSQWWVDWMVRNISNISQTIQMYNIWFYGHMRIIPVTCVQWDPMYQHASLFEKLYRTCHWAKNYRKRFSIYMLFGFCRLGLRACHINTAWFLFEAREDRQLESFSPSDAVDIEDDSPKCWIFSERIRARTAWIWSEWSTPLKEIWRKFRKLSRTYQKWQRDILRFWRDTNPQLSCPCRRPHPLNLA